MDDKARQAFKVWFPEFIRLRGASYAQRRSALEKAFMAGWNAAAAIGLLPQEA